MYSRPAGLQKASQPAPLRIVSTMMNRRLFPRALAAASMLTLLAGCVARPLVVAAPEPRATVEPAGHADEPAPAPAPASLAADIDYLRTRHLAMPVAGADIERVHDSFDAPRDGGRHHNAIDILAPRGTPVLAADDGRILRLSSNSLGGITIYAVSPTSRFVYYYAHLERYRDALAVGQPLTRGDTIGYVGTTGDAPKNTPHLHFQIIVMPADGKYWNGEAIDPWPLLREQTP
jgi:murein DD-endopeptidase MepM/ murein hydrolase activator NlpD